MSQEYENEAGRSRARQSRRRPSGEGAVGGAERRTVRTSSPDAERRTVRTSSPDAERRTVRATSPDAERRTVRTSSPDAERRAVRASYSDTERRTVRATPPDAGRRRSGIGQSRDEEGIRLWNELASRAEGERGRGAAAHTAENRRAAARTAENRATAARTAGSRVAESRSRRETAAAMAEDDWLEADTGRSGGSGGRGGTGGGSGQGREPGRRRPTATNRQDSPEAKRRRRIIKFIIAECFALVFIFAYAFVARRWSLLQRDETFSVQSVKNEELADETLEKMEGYWTVAVFGVDSRGSNTGKGANADVNMVFNINRDTGEIRIVSVFRDSYLNIDDKGSYNKLNQAYFVGGASQAVKALNKNLDLDIQDYVTFNWKAVADAINILGGIDMEISKAEFSYINSFITETQKATGIPTTQLKSAGMNHLDGVQAVAYGRLRLMDTDFARTERQRKVIQAAFEKAKKADFSVLNNIIVTVAPQVSTNIDTMDLVRMAQDISKYHIGETGGFPFARGDANMGKKGACVIPTTLESNVVELHKFLFDDEDYTTTDQVKQISAKIISDTGLSKEGEFVYHADTSGGSVYRPTTAAAEEETSEVLETDEDGNPIETEEPETDEDGNIIETKEPETDEDGNPIETEEPETDEDGNPIETEEYETDEFGMIVPTRPGHTSESESQSRPGHTAGSGSQTRPGHTSESESQSRPGHTSGSQSRPGGTETSGSSRPTASSEETSRAPIVNSPTRPEETTVNWSGPGGDLRESISAPGSTGDGVILPPSTTAAAPETSPQAPIAPLS